MKFLTILRAIVLTIVLESIAFSGLAYPFAVTTPNPYATEAAIEMLKKGGNATDAMVAASLTLNVSSPYAMGIGGGGFYLAHVKAGRPKAGTYYWDHREQAPKSAHDKMFLLPDGSEIPFYPERVSGPNPVGIPGTPLGLFEAHKKLGKLPWKTVVAPAVRLAQEGYTISPLFEKTLNEEWARLELSSTAKKLFGDNEGSYLKSGRLFRQPMLAKTLATLGERGAPDFYTGTLAKSWLAQAQALGVAITEEDLKNYRVIERKPIEFKLFGLTGITAPPPSAAGLMVAGTLRFLDQYYGKHALPDAFSAERIIVNTEAVRFFQKLRNETIAEPPFSTIDPQKFLGSAQERAAWIAIEKQIERHLDLIQTQVAEKKTPALISGSQGPVQQTLPKTVQHPGHTAHLSIIDDHGMTVSYTTTIEEWFGSGLVVPEHGFLLNNELSDFSATPGQPNSAAAGKRPRSNMSPTILLDGGTPVAIAGCAGGGLIPVAVGQILENYYLHKLNARQSVGWIRWYPDPEDGKLQIDPSASAALVEKLKTAGYEVKIEPVASFAQVILRRDVKSQWEAAPDPRSEGTGNQF